MKFFELIPKPDIVDPSKKNSLMSIRKYKSKINKLPKDLPSSLKAMVGSKDSINQKIYECLDNKMKIGMDSGLSMNGIFYVFADNIINN